MEPLNFNRVPLLFITLLHIVGQWIINSAHLRAPRYYICTIFGFSCKALFSDSFSVYALHEKFLNMELFLVRIFLHSH